MTTPRYGQRRDPIVPNAPSATPSARPVSAETQRIIDRAKERAKPIPTPRPASNEGLGQRSLGPGADSVLAFGKGVARGLFDTATGFQGETPSFLAPKSRPSRAESLFGAIGSGLTTGPNLAINDNRSPAPLEVLGGFAPLYNSASQGFRATMSVKESFAQAGINLAESVKPTTTLGKVIRAPAQAMLGVLPPPGGVGKIIRYSDDIPPGGQPRLPAPAQADVTVRSAADPLGLRDIVPGLTKMEELKNRLMPVRKILTRSAPDEPISAPALRERARLQPVIVSAANDFAAKGGERIERAFSLSPTGQVDALVGVDPKLIAKSDAKAIGATAGQEHFLAPTIQDIAARYPLYKPHLTPAQIQAMDWLKMDAEPYAATLERVGVDLKSRGDIMDGGFYLPRGGSEEPGMAERLKIYSGGLGRGKKGFEKEAQFPSQAFGIEQGYKYEPFRDALASYGKQAGKDIVDEHLSNYFKTVSVDGKPIATPITEKATASEMRGGHPLGLPNLQFYNFPDEVANAVNDVLAREAKHPGLAVVESVNNFMLGLKATGDLSFTGIQALLGWYNAPAATGKAFGLSLKALRSPRALGSFLLDHDIRALGNNTISTSEMVKAGLHIGGAETEFTARSLGKVPVVRQLNRAFGNTGDGLRVEWMDDLIQEQVGRGKSIVQMQASGELEQLAGIANRMTGWTPNKTAGWAGDLLLFAPRFLQSRLETMANAVGSLRPGASLQQKVARRSILRMVGIGTAMTVALNEMQGRDTDFALMKNGHRNTNFMRVRFAGRDWSMFGTWDSLLGAFISVGSGKPQEAYRNLSSPVVSKAWDVATGSNAIGERTRDNAGQIIGTIADTFAPINASEYLTLGEQASGGDIGPAALGVTGNFVGAKSSPTTPTERFQDYVALKEGKPFDQVSDIRVQFYKNQDPEGRTLQAENKAKYDDRPNDPVHDQEFNETLIKGHLQSGSPPFVYRKEMLDLGVSPKMVKDKEVRAALQGFEDFKDKANQTGYWAIADNLLASKPDQLATYTHFKALEEANWKVTEIEAEIGTAGYQMAKGIDALVTLKQKKLREADPDLEVGLVRYYGRAPVTGYGEIERARQHRISREAQKVAS